MKGAIAGWRLACFHAFAAPVAERFVDHVFIIVVVGILFVNFADHAPFKRILRADLPRWKTHFVRLARYIIVGRAKLAIAAP